MSTLNLTLEQKILADILFQAMLNQANVTPASEGLAVIKAIQQLAINCADRLTLNDKDFLNRCGVVRSQDNQ